MTVILKIKEVSKISSLSKATIYREIKKGKFPAPVQLTDRSVGWLETDIDAWILSRQIVSLARYPEIWRAQ